LATTIFSIYIFLQTCLKIVKKIQKLTPRQANNIQQRYNLITIILASAILPTMLISKHCFNCKKPGYFVGNCGLMVGSYFHKNPMMKKHHMMLLLELCQFPKNVSAVKIQSYIRNGTLHLVASSQPHYLQKLKHYSKVVNLINCGILLLLLNPVPHNGNIQISKQHTALPLLRDIDTYSVSCCTQLLSSST